MSSDRAYRLRALVVEDDRDCADSFAILLGLFGFDSSVARDGAEGLDVAERLRPDVVFLDIGLPKLNGYLVCRQIRQSEWGSQLAVIAVTGWSQEADFIRSIEAGFDAHLVKPVGGEDLIRAVKQALRVRGVQRCAQAWPNRADLEARSNGAQRMARG
jgi:DNA-binding response OmpR family regulator